MRGVDVSYHNDTMILVEFDSGKIADKTEEQAEEILNPTEEQKKLTCRKAFFLLLMRRVDLYGSFPNWCVHSRDFYRARKLVRFRSDSTVEQKQ